MVEFIDILLIIGGWIVAGLVTLAGVLVAHRIQERSRQRREDRLGVYEPLRKELTSIIDRGSLVKNGYNVWSPSEAFTEMLRLGQLNPTRHDDLRNDVNELVRLGDAADKAYSEFYDARQDAIRAAWETTDYFLEGTGERAKLTKLLGLNFSNDQMNQALSGSDKNWFLLVFDDLVGGAARGQQKQFKVAVAPGDLYDKIMRSIEGPRKNFVAREDAVLRKAQEVLSNIDMALAAESAYHSR